ncbi:flagellar assembly protein FliW [Bacillus sp. SCS-151]|uniref:flagellar assembly protein FliW n=1 Tax=Nanhaiella sioensis TaxID=3115293 RepID=UPI00397AC7D3
MEINTKYHGTVNINNDDMITFANGIPGFLDEKEFVIIPFSQGTPFQILQSVCSKDVAFTLIEPFSYFQDYTFELDSRTLDQLNIILEENVAIYNIITVHEPFTNTTVNLQAPIVINAEKRVGKQVILTNTSYHTKHNLFTQKQKLMK